LAGEGVGKRKNVKNRKKPISIGGDKRKEKIARGRRKMGEGEASSVYSQL